MKLDGQAVGLAVSFGRTRPLGSEVREVAAGQSNAMRRVSS